MTADDFPAGTQATFDQNRRFLFNIDSDIGGGIPDAIADERFSITFSAPNGAQVQDVTVVGLTFNGLAILARGKTGVNLPVAGVGGSGAVFRAAIQDDPFREDLVGINQLLNNATAVAGIQAGVFPRGTSPNGFGPGSTSNFDAPNFFGPKVNTLAITLEIPSAALTSAPNVIGVWASTVINGIQVDRAGRPGINTLLIPPVPRGSNFPILQPGPGVPPNRVDRRDAFNAGQPQDDRANFRADMISVLTAFWPAGRPGGNPSAAQAGVLADLLLPDMLVFQVGNAAGFGTPLSVSGQTFLGNGRKLSDDVVSTLLAILTDDDLPAAFGGGPNPPALVTQNVKDDNGQNLTDGSTEPPPPQGNGAAGTGTVRPIAFPYIGGLNT